MLRRIRGTAISFCQSRISKVLAPIIVAALTLLLFLSGSVRAYAITVENGIVPDEWDIYIEDNAVSFSFSFLEDDLVISNGIINGTDDKYVVFDIYVPITIHFSLGSSYDSSYSYFGFAQKDFTFRTATVPGNAIGNFDFYEYTAPEFINLDNDLVISLEGRSYPMVQGEPTGVIDTFNIRYMLRDNRNNPDYYKTFVVHYKQVISSKYSYLDLLQFRVSTFTPSTNLSYTNISRIPLSEISNDEVYNIVSDLYDDIKYDSSGVSDNITDIQDNYSSVQATADEAVDNAMHSYDNQLERVEDLDLSSFFNTQRYGLNFWRSVGEFILDSANLGYIATGLIVVTVINLFVFLLRL